MHEAVTAGHYEAVQLLLEKGADINKVDNDGATPLISAAMSGHKDVVELLLAAGADKSVEDNWGTALDAARESGHAEVAALLE